jgi:ribosomal protein L32
VANEQAKAERNDRRIVSQTVTLNTSICPECGRVYVSGGVTRTITANKQDNNQNPIETGSNSAG